MPAETTAPTYSIPAYCQNCKFMHWAEQFEQANKEGGAREFFASDRKAAKEFFPVYVKERLGFERERRFGVPTFMVRTPDYEVRFDNICDEHPPKMTIHSRTRHIMSETYEGKVDDLAEYATKRMGRTGLSRLALNEVPDALASAMSKSDDFFHNLFYPITSRAGKFIDECLD